jgi:hypothetical protein
LLPTSTCSSFTQAFILTTTAGALTPSPPVSLSGPDNPRSSASTGKRFARGKSRSSSGKKKSGKSSSSSGKNKRGKSQSSSKSSPSRGKKGSSGKGSSASCDYAEAFGNAIAAGFEASSGFPVGTGPLDNVLDSVVASNVGGCPSTATQTATVVLTYKPESTPVDPVALADAARAWQTEAPFPMTIDVCGCTATIELTGTTSGYAEFTGKGTPKSGKCKGGFSPVSTPKSPKKLSSVASSVGTQSTSAAVVTGSTVVVLVVFVAMALIKRRARLPTQPSTNTELAWDCHELPRGRDS